MPMPTAVPRVRAEAAGRVSDGRVKRSENGARRRRGEDVTDAGLGQREGVEAPDHDRGDDGGDGREHEYPPVPRRPQRLTAHRQWAQEPEPAGPSSSDAKAVAPAIATPEERRQEQRVDLAVEVARFSRQVLHAERLLSDSVFVRSSSAPPSRLGQNAAFRTVSTTMPSVHQSAERRCASNPRTTSSGSRVGLLVEAEERLLEIGLRHQQMLDRVGASTASSSPGGPSTTPDTSRPRTTRSPTPSTSFSSSIGGTAANQAVNGCRAVGADRRPRRPRRHAPRGGRSPRRRRRHLAEYVRGEEDRPALGATSSTRRMNSSCTSGSRAAGQLVQHEQLGLRHEGADEPYLPTVAGREVARAAANVEVEALAEVANVLRFDGTAAQPAPEVERLAHREPFVQAQLSRQVADSARAGARASAGLPRAPRRRWSAAGGP